MNIQKFFTTALALSLVAAPIHATEVTPDTTSVETEFVEVNLDLQTFDDPYLLTGDSPVEMPQLDSTSPEVTPPEENIVVPAFTDMENHWGKALVDTAVSRGYFVGTSDTTFSPDKEISRLEYTIVILQVRNATLVEKSADQPTWYDHYYETAVLYGILPETVNYDNFTQSMTREEMATMTILALGQGNFAEAEENPADLSDFDLVSPAYAGYVSQTIAAGFMTGGTDGTFNPGGFTDRAQASVVAVRAGDFLATEQAPEQEEVEEPLVGNAQSELYASILDSLRPEETLSMVPTIKADADPMWQMFLEPNFGITADQLEAYAIAYPVIGTIPYCVAIMSPAEGELDAVLAGVEGMVSSWIDPVGGLIPYPVLSSAAETAIIETITDDIVIFVMISEEGEEMAVALKEALTLG